MNETAGRWRVECPRQTGNGWLGGYTRRTGRALNTVALAPAPQA